MDGVVIMREKDFENQIKEYLKKMNCWYVKTWSNGIQREGIPDLIICVNGFFLGVEVKAKNGRPTELQKWNVKKIKEAGGIAIILYPDQFDQFKELIYLLKLGFHNNAQRAQNILFERSSAKDGD